MDFPYVIKVFTVIKVVCKRCSIIEVLCRIFCRVFVWLKCAWFFPYGFQQQRRRCSLIIEDHIQKFRYFWAKRTIDLKFDIRRWCTQAKQAWSAKVAVIVSYPSSVNGIIVKKYCYICRSCWSRFARTNQKTIYWYCRYFSGMVHVWWLLYHGR